MLLHILLQEIINPDSLLKHVEPEGFNITPTNIYGWFVWGLVGACTYLKIESSLKSWTIKQKDKYIKELVKQLIDAEKNSITAEEATIYKVIESKHKKALTQNSQVESIK